MNQNFPKHKMKYYLPAVLGVLFLLANGCAGGLKQKSVKPFLTSLEAWPEMYRQNFNAIDTFLGKARLTVESRQFSGNLSMETYWVSPDKLFFRAEGPLGLDVGKIFIGSDRFIVYNQYDNHFTAGSIDDPYLNRFWQTNFTLKELKYAALGYVKQIEEPVRLADDLHGIFENQIGDIKYRFIVNPGTGLLESCEAIRNGNVFMKQEFKNYRVVGGFYVPQIVQITLLDQQERISIFYKDIEINKTIDPEKYTIEISPKVEQLNLN